MSRGNRFDHLISCAVRTLIEAPAYAVGVGVYACGAAVASLRMKKARDMRRGHKDVWRILREKRREGDRYLWFHASSLGEFEQGRPLMEMIRREHPEYKIALTFFSPSGYEVRKNYDGADLVAYLPFDLPGNVRRFVRLLHPEKAFFIKYEFWRNYLGELHRRGIPTYLISGIFRQDQLFFRKYGAGYRNWLRWFTRLYVQDEHSRALLSSVGINNVTVAGDTRFDRVTDIMRVRKKVPEVAAFVENSEFTLCAGSSWPADEHIYFPWLKARPEVKCVIAPHEFDAERIARLKEAFPGKAVTLSEVRANPETLAGKRILIIDCFGLLSSIYSYCDAAWIGGAFGSGLHNINEAAVYGLPVVFGPRHDKFIEAAGIIDAGGGFSVSSEDEARELLNHLLSDQEQRLKASEAARCFIRSKLGATHQIYSDIFGRDI